MTTIGIINPERLTLIPKAHHGEHEFCFHLHDLMLRLLVDAEASRANHVTIKFEDTQQMELFQEIANSEDTLSALEKLGYEKDAKRVVLNQLSMALISDSLQFIHEGLKALEKGKITVAFSLFRKPFQEGMLFLSWMCADEDEFFDAFWNNDIKQLESERIKPPKRLQIFEAAIARLHAPSLFAPDLIYTIAFERETDRGLRALFDQSVHLVTTRSLAFKTENRNLNMIFMDPMNSGVYEFAYFRLSYLLIYILSLQISLYERMGPVDPTFKNWAALVAYGTHHALFCEGDSDIMKSLRPVFRRFMKCPHCRRGFKVGKKETPKFLVCEEVQCKGCGNEFRFPLFWLLSQADWSIRDDVPTVG